MVPLPEPVLTVTVRVLPLPVTPVIEVPDTPDAFRLKLPLATPLTDSLKVTRNVMVEALVGVVVGAIETTVGMDLLTVRTVPLLYVAVRALPAMSLIAGAVLLRSRRTVPSPEPV